MHLDQLKRFGARKGAWAVVTGATDGIGKEFSYQLAKNGFNVLLVARNPQLLSETAIDIGQSYALPYRSTDLQLGLESKYKVSALTHSIDFSKSSHEAYDELASTCEGLDIGVLGMFVCFVIYSPMLMIASK